MRIGRGAAENPRKPGNGRTAVSPPSTSSSKRRPEGGAKTPIRPRRRPGQRCLAASRKRSRYLVALLAPCLAVLLHVDRANARNLSSCEPTDAALTVTADNVQRPPGRNQINFSGDVTATYDGTRLTTETLSWDRDAGELALPDNFEILSPDATVIRGDRGSFSQTLGSGSIKTVDALIRGGPGRLQADDGERKENGDLLLSEARYSPCPTSDSNPTPIWWIDADEVRHDAEARDIVYRNAVLRVAELPVFYLPHFRTPDPQVKARSGLLLPSLESDSAFGIGVRIPYHLAIAPDRDATVTGFLTTNDGPVLEGEYRQLFRRGELNAEGSLAPSLLYAAGPDSTDRTHGHLLMNLSRPAAFGFDLDADIRLASQKGYLRRYGYSEEDRLQNRIAFSRFRRGELISAEAVAFQTQRGEESSRQLTFALPEVQVQRILPQAAFGGELQFRGDFRHLGCVNCRRSAAAGAEAEWSRQSLFRNGLVARYHLEGRADAYRFGNHADATDGRRRGSAIRLFPQARGEFSWPWIGVSKAGAHYVEPMVQFIAAPDRSRESEEIPNEDSLDVEFDEHSLFAGNRHSGRDRIESGHRGAYGLRYHYRSATGLQFGSVVGRVVRRKPLQDFPEQSGLRGRHTDIVGAWSLRTPSPLALSVSHRLRLSPSLAVRRNDLVIRGHGKRLRFDATWLFVDPDTDSGIFETTDRGEIQSNASFQLNDLWSLHVEARRDLENHRTIEIDTALLFEHDCIQIRTSVERDYISSLNAPAGTTFRISVNLINL